MSLKGITWQGRGWRGLAWGLAGASGSHQLGTTACSLHVHCMYTAETSVGRIYSGSDRSHKATDAILALSVAVTIDELCCDRVCWGCAGAVLVLHMWRRPAQVLA